MLSCIYDMHQGEVEFQMFEIMIQYSIFCFVLIMLDFFAQIIALEANKKVPGMLHLYFY